MESFRGRAPMHADETELNRLSTLTVGCALVVANTLGPGFLEKIYENALAHELRKAGIFVTQQHGVVVRYDGIVIGEYAVDILVAGCLVVELKAVMALNRSHQAQCLHYLKATGLRLCLLLNFGGPSLEIKRLVCGL
jgi:GxxExxY protein